MSKSKTPAIDPRIRLANIQAAVDQMALVPAYDGSAVHDHVTMANASLFVEGNFSEPLTAYATGWRDPENIEETLNFYAPEVRAPRRFEYAQHVNIEEFLSEDDDKRAPRGDFKTVEYTSEKVNAKTDNHGLRTVIDLDQVGDQQNWRENAVAKLLRRSRRNSLRRAITLISAAATNAAKTWDTTAGKDPDQDVIEALILAQTASGIYPNRVGYGQTAFSKRMLAHRAQDSAGGFASAGMTPEQIAGLLNVDRVHVSRERYQSSASAKSEVVGALVLMFMAMDSMDTEDPSNIKRFVSPTVDGGMVRVYERELTSKLYEIVVEHYEKTVITSTLGLRKLTIS